MTNPTPTRAAVVLTGTQQAYQPAPSFNGWIDGAVIANTHSAAVDVTIWRTLAGGSTSTAATILPLTSIDAGATLKIGELIGQWVLSDDTIVGRASVDGVVAFNLSAREFPAA